MIQKITPGLGGQAKYCALIGKLAALALSSDDAIALRNAVTELGEALGLARVSILITRDGEPGGVAEYNRYDPGEMEKHSRRLLDVEVMRRVDGLTSLVELSDSEIQGLRAAKTRSGREGYKRSIGSALAVPLVIGSQSVGAAILYKARGRRWNDTQRHFAQVVASTLSLALDHFETRKKAQGAAHRESLTQEMLTAIRSAVAVDEILQIAVDGIGKTLNVTRVVIFVDPVGLVRGDSGDLWSTTARAEYRQSALVPSLLNTVLDVAASPLRSQLLLGETIAIADTSQSHPFVQAMSVRLGVRALAMAPIVYDGRTVGTILMEQFERTRVFSEEELRLVKLVTEQTAVALHHADLYRDARESARRDALITRISSAIHGCLDSDSVLTAIVNELGQALSVCRCRIALLPSPMPESIQITHEYVAECCLKRPAAKRTSPVVDNPHLHAVLASERPVAIEDAATHPLFAPLKHLLDAARVKSILSTTIRLGGRPIGFISLHQCEHRHAWTQWEIDVVKSVAEQAAVAIRQAELYREAGESAMQAALVNQIIASIRRSLDLNETLRVATQELGRLLGADRSVFRKLIGDELVPVAEHLSDPSLSVSDVRRTIDDYITTYLMETRRTLIVDDVPAFIAAHPEVAATVRTWQIEPINLSQIVCPVFVEGRFWGELSMGQTSRLRKWSASEVALLEMVTAQVEVAVSHSYLFEETKQAARREALISRIVHRINESNQLEEIFPMVAQELGERLSADRIVVGRFEDRASKWVLDSEYSEGQTTRPAETMEAAQFIKLVGLARGDLVQCNDVEKDKRLASDVLKQLRQAGIRSFVTARIVHKGVLRLIVSALQSHPRAWSSEEVELIRAVASQVSTGLQRAELFKQVSLGKLEWEATFDALSDGILIFDREGKLRRVNEAGAAFEGAPIRELIGRKCCSMMQGVEGEVCRVAQVLKTGRPATFELVPERLKRPVLVTISPLTSNDSFAGEVFSAERNAVVDLDAPHGAVCIVRDLSALRAAEAAAREQRNFLVKLIEHANDAIFALSTNGELIWFNEQLITLSGYSRSELVSADYHRFVTGDDKRVARERFAGALTGEPQTFELRAERKSGEARLLLITYTPIYDEEGVTSVLSIARDITEERLASERAAQADKLRALGQLASGVAHNFNNILAAILGHAQLMKRDTNEETELQRIEIIERAALDGAATVKRIQGFGLQENESASERVDLNSLIKDSTALTQAKWYDEARARGLRYQVVFDLKTVPVVNGSASELREVFVNIILNALDAMPQGGRLRITSEEKDGSVRVSFRDSGVGMSRDVCKRIFEPFFTTKGTAGMGLGLAVSYGTVERHGGRIDVQSRPGRGTTFTVTLPVAGAAPPSSMPPSKLPLDVANVLVVDDEEDVREALVGMLNSAGHRTEYASSGPEAIAKMEQRPFDLVFTDLSMPEMDGWTLATELKRRWPAAKIVVITGQPVSKETVDRNRKLVNTVVLKPLQFDDVCATVSSVLS